MHERKSVSRGPRKVQRSARAGDKRMSGVVGKAAPRAKCGRALKHMGNHQEIAVGRSGERRLGQRVIESKASVMWYYETVADHSLATPVASDSHAPDTLPSYFSLHHFHTVLTFHHSTLLCLTTRCESLAVSGALYHGEVLMHKSNSSIQSIV